MTERRLNFEEQAAHEWRVVIVSAVTALVGLAAFAALFLN